MSKEKKNQKNRFTSTKAALVGINFLFSARTVAVATTFAIFLFIYIIE